MRCPLCTCAIPENSTTCQDCGHQMTASRNEFFLAAIGPNPQAYLDDFIEYEENGKALGSWHWPAFFFTLLWLLHRKMYSAAGLYIVLVIALGWIAVPILSAVFSTFLPSLNWLPALGIYAAFWIIPALFAKRLYYRHCSKLIAFNQRVIQDPRQQLEQTKRQGGTGPAGYIVLAVGAVGIVPVMGILAAIAIPAYQDYVSKSRLTQTYLHMQQIADALTEHYATQQTLPQSLASLGVDSQATPSLPAIVLDNDGTLNSHFQNPAALKDKTLRLVPSLDPQGKLVWLCDAEEIPLKLRPSACR